MKNIMILTLITFFTITSILRPDTAQASLPTKVFVNGKEIHFTFQPISLEGRTLVEFRVIFEALGMAVGWDSKSKKVTGTGDGLTIQLVLDKKEAIVNDKKEHWM